MRERSKAAGAGTPNIAATDSIPPSAGALRIAEAKGPAGIKSSKANRFASRSADVAVEEKEAAVSSWSGWPKAMWARQCASAKRRRIGVSVFDKVTTFPRLVATQPKAKMATVQPMRSAIPAGSTGMRRSQDMARIFSGVFMSILPSFRPASRGGRTATEEDAASCLWTYRTLTTTLRSWPGIDTRAVP